MIFLTVGTQIGFDRLIKAVDEWALLQPQQTIFAQIGKAHYKPENFKYTEFLSPKEYKEVFDSCSYVVSHAGMGTIISCLMSHKPILVMPRKAKLSEHRNDHQFATCERFSDKEGCYIAWDEYELVDYLNVLHTLKPSSVDSKAGLAFSDALLKEVTERFGF